MTNVLLLSGLKSQNLEIWSLVVSRAQLREKIQTDGWHIAAAIELDENTFAVTLFRPAKIEEAFEEFGPEQTKAQHDNP